jgi:hypothetical protein
VRGNCSLGLGWLPCVREALALNANEALVREIPSRELREARESNWDFPLDKRARSFTHGAIGVARGCFSERNRYAVCVCVCVPFAGTREKAVPASRSGRSAGPSISEYRDLRSPPRSELERGLTHETMGDRNAREEKICWIALVSHARDSETLKESLAGEDVQ